MNRNGISIPSEFKSNLLLVWNAFSILLHDKCSGFFIRMGFTFLSGIKLGKKSIPSKFHLLILTFLNPLQSLATTVLNYHYPEHGALRKILCLMKMASLIHSHYLFYTCYTEKKKRYGYQSWWLSKLLLIYSVYWLANSPVWGKLQEKSGPCQVGMCAPDYLAHHYKYHLHRPQSGQFVIYVKGSLVVKPNLLKTCFFAGNWGFSHFLSIK